MKKNKKNNILEKIDDKFYTIFSIVLAFLIWKFIANSSAGAVFANPTETFQAFLNEWAAGRIQTHIFSSLLRVIVGFSLGLVVATPVAFLMGWYRPIRLLVEPVIQFLRNIPALAYIPLIVVAQGVAESAKITVIFIATFLVMVITIYQGVKNVDVTLIKAARVLGANDKDIFFKVIIPASFPYMLVGIKLGLGSALTTLIAAELTGAQEGLGQMIQEASLYFRMDIVILGIVLIGILGMLLNKTVSQIEKKLAGWQETIKN